MTTTLTPSFQLTGSFSGGPFQYGFGYDAVSGNYYVAHVSMNMSGEIVDLASDATLASAVTALQAIEISTTAGATAAGQASALTALQAIETATAAGATSVGQASALTALQAIETSTAASATATGQASTLTELQTIATLVTKQPPLSYSDISGATSGTAAAFTTLVPANAVRGYLRVSNTSASGTIYVFDKITGTASATNSIALLPGQHFVWEKGVPGGVIQIAGSVASMTFEGAEGV